MASPDYSIPPWLTAAGNQQKMYSQQAAEHFQQGQEIASQIQRTQQLKASAAQAANRKVAEQKRQTAIGAATQQFANDPTALMNAVALANIQFGVDADIGAPALGASVKALTPKPQTEFHPPDSKLQAPGYFTGPKPTFPPAQPQAPTIGMIPPTPGGPGAIPFVKTGNRVAFPPSGALKPATMPQPRSTIIPKGAIGVLPSGERVTNAPPSVATPPAIPRLLKEEFDKLTPEQQTNYVSSIAGAQTNRLNGAQSQKPSEAKTFPTGTKVKNAKGQIKWTKNDGTLPDGWMPVQ